jgi:8-oxo-dGTP pyrophosphatase MutT (NUDIX family)
MLISYGTRSMLAERLRRIFGAPPSRVQVAALPWRRTPDGRVEVMLVTSRGTGRWVLPKGWPEGGETLFHAAEREAEEEAGVTGGIAHAPLGSFFYGKRQPSGLEKRCEVRVFPLEVDREADRWPEAGVRTREWLSAETAASRVAEPDLGELIMRFARNPRQSAA